MIGLCQEMCLNYQLKPTPFCLASSKKLLLSTINPVSVQTILLRQDLNHDFALFERRQ